MKLNFSTLLATVMLLLTFCSCRKTETYSCDSNINKWVNENRDQLQHLTREQLVSYQSVDSQFAVYRALTPEAKCAVWKRKMEIVSNEYGLTEAENAHIRKVINFAKPEFWGERKNELKQWGAEWERNAMTQFGWDTAKTVLIAETWLTGPELQHLKELKTKGSPTNANASRAYIPPPDPDCTCNYSIYCALGSAGVCLTGACSTASGCGFLGNGDCKGRCG